MFFLFFIFTLFCFTENDSLTVKNEKNLDYIRVAYKEKNWVLFNKIRLQHLNSISSKNLSNTNALIFDFSAAYFRKVNKLDSAFYYYQKSFKIYNNKKDSLKAGRMLLNMAIIQKNVFNFKESETNSLRALDYLKNQKKDREKSSIYNNLGIIYYGLQDYKNAIKYHNKALIIRKKIKNDKLIISSLNNIANVYKEKKEYDRAIILYKKALGFKDVLKTKLKTKATLLDNYAHTLFLKKENTNLPKLFLKALQIRDSLNDIPGKIVSNMHLGVYYTSLGENKLALQFLNKAKKLAKSINYVKDEIEVMELLLPIYPKKQALKEAKLIIFKKDSIQKQERNIKESISRVKFESSEKEKENLELKAEKATQKLLTQRANTRNWLLLVGLAVVGLISFVLYRRYKAETKAKTTIANQKEVIENLQKELHHRIKNNLSVINTFIEVAKEEFTGENVADKLTEIQNRVYSINQIHKQLYKNKDVTQLKVKNYINILIKNVTNTYAKKNITFKNNIDNISLNPAISFPIGQIINEFLTNTFKYAFLDDKGTISITFKEEKENYLLKLTDNGKGLPANFNFKETTTFGFRIMQLLTQQINGIFTLESKNGVQLTINIPKK